LFPARGSSMREQSGADHERSDVDPAIVGWIAMGLALFVLAVPLVMPLVFPQSIYRGNPAARPALAADAPSLEVNPSSSLRRQREADGEFAHSYGWIDREHKFVRIPVARAVERLLQTGLPNWPSR
jgi:hypothetical protein